jgi:hypothetical protein
MSYRDTTYVVFDADNNRWAYARMKGWNALRNIDFDFENAHDINSLRDWSSEETVKRKLRERFKYTEQVILLIGKSTKNLHRYVRWELDVALALDLPIIAVNLNSERSIDLNLCPPIIRDEYVVHIPFRMRIIKYAMDNFPNEYHKRDLNAEGRRSYSQSVYKSLEL